jgi:FAD/FMN-containing dehydrogenase
VEVFASGNRMREGVEGAEYAKDSLEQVFDHASWGFEYSVSLEPKGGLLGETGGSIEALFCQSILNMRFN